MSVTVTPVRTRPQTAAAVPAVVGSRLKVPLVTGELIDYASLDHAASAPCLEHVRDAVAELLPWYSSVHRGAGFASRVCGQVYEQARETLRRFTGARSTDTVVFTRNTTDSLNLLARCLPRGTSVVSFDADHHAALLPWRGPNVRRIRTPHTVDALVRELEAALRACPEGPRLVVLTGASNVTGELWPVSELAAAARRHGARTVLDAAQLAPHRPVDASALDVDYTVLSGHKLYAPFGAGALIGRDDWLRAAEPYLVGGGATANVADRGDRLAISWSATPQRHEAGSPNVVGVHALAAACEAITRHGWAPIRTHERILLARLRSGLADVPGLRELSLFDGDRARVGVVGFTIDGHAAGLVAAVLSAEYGIGVRDGAFCAHLATRRLTARTGTDASGALRASLGLGSTAEHVDRLVAALRAVVTEGPRWGYRIDGDRWVPDPDPRPLPPFVAA
ncbi:MAG: aminotransferase class V-fold PLP-dependent enzyme [Kutzneria sp.]|nr:aminotransferase class V-fold PLP-dependent enzyme [Kutzneria sp.]